MTAYRLRAFDYIPALAKKVASDIAQQIAEQKADPKKLIILFGENHFQLDQMVLQTQLMRHLNHAIGVSHLAEENPKVLEKKLPECDGENTGAVAKQLSEKTNWAFRSCLIPAYTKVNGFSYHGIDLSGQGTRLIETPEAYQAFYQDIPYAQNLISPFPNIFSEKGHSPTTLKGLIQRELHMAGKIHDIVQNTQKPLFVVCGNGHIGYNSLLDLVLATGKQAISIVLRDEIEQINGYDYTERSVQLTYPLREAHLEHFDLYKAFDENWDIEHTGDDVILYHWNEFQQNALKV